MPSFELPEQPVKLTVSLVRKIAEECRATPPTRRRDIRDAEQPGLTLRVYPSGALSWAARYNVKGDKVPKDPTLGPADASTLTAKAIEELRQRVAEIRRTAAQGRDLLSEERQAQLERRAIQEAADSRLRVRDAVQLFLREYRGKSRGRVLSQASVKGYRAMAHRLIAVCGDLWVDQLTGDKAMRPARQLEKDGKMAAAHAYSVALGTALRWLGKRKVVPLHLHLEIERAGSIGRRERVLEKHDMADLLTAARQLGYPWQGVVELLIYTGARVAEIAELRVAEVRLDEGMLLLPADRTKSRREHAIPLTARTRAIVEAALAQRPEKSPFVFSTTGNTTVSGFSKMKARLDDLMVVARARRAGREQATADDLVEAWVLHDLRRSLRTAASACGVDFEIKELLLGHVPAALTATYDRYTYLTERRAALEAVERRYDGFEAAARGEPGAKVVALRAG